MKLLKTKSYFLLFFVFLASLTTSSCRREPVIADEGIIHPDYAAFQGFNIADFSSIQVWNGMLYFQSQEHYHSVINQIQLLETELASYAQNNNNAQGNAQSGNGGGDNRPEKVRIVYNPQGPFEGKNPMTGQNLPPIQTINQYWLNDDPVLYLFEISKNFRSLRQYLTEQTYAMMSAGSFDPDINNPDDFYLKDDYLRTFMNPSLEIRVGNSIYKSLSSTCMIEITNANTQTLAYFREKYPQNIIWTSAQIYPTVEIVKGLPVVHGQGNIIIHETADPLDATACTAGYSFSVSTFNYKEYSFTNSSAPSSGLYYSWDFGDGSTSTLTDPVHTYLSDGTYSVTLYVYEIGSPPMPCDIEIKTITVANTSCTASFSIDDSPIGEVDFTNSSTTASGDNIISYLWDFGDGNTSADASPTHQYGYNGTFQVCLTITTSQGCSDEICQFVTISLECCRAKDPDPTTQASGDYRLKGWIWLDNIPFARKAGAKTKSYRRNASGNWVNANSSTIEAHVAGNAYDRECESDTSFSPLPNIRSNDNIARTHTPGSFSGPVRAKLGSIGSFHRGVRSGTNIQFSKSMIDPSHCD